MRSVAAFLLAASLLSQAACKGGYGSPEETLETLRAAVAARDAATLYAATDSEGRAFHRDNVRIWKARLERGDDLATFREQLPLAPDLLRSLSVEEAATRWIGSSGPVARLGAWLETARVVGAPVVRAENEQGLVLRGRDGSERELWFLREDGRWLLDVLQTERALR